MTTLLLTLWTALATMAIIQPISSSSTAQPTPSTPPAHLTYTPSTNTGPLRIAVIGLTHGHVEGLLYAATKRDDLQIVGIYEPSRVLFDKLATKYNLKPDLYFANLSTMLDTAKPEAASVMGSIKDHRSAVEACAPRGVHTLLEKPLAFSNDDAVHMAALAAKHRVLVLTNYETSWYASVRQAKAMVDDGTMSPIRRMIFRHGHKGPKEIGCQSEFLNWLTDPAQNGGGTLVDFGCYGAVLSTWLMNGQRPTSVTASATTLKPHMYPNVDDDATIIVTYPTATATIQASWAWTHDNKEMDLHTERGSIHAGKWNELAIRSPDQPLHTLKPTPKPADLENEWTYLRMVVRGQTPIDPLSSLELNVIAVEILDAARLSIKMKRDPGSNNSPNIPLPR